MQHLPSNKARPITAVKGRNLVDVISWGVRENAHYLQCSIIYHCNILYIHIIYIYISYHYDISYSISILFYYCCWMKGLKSPFFEDVHRWHEVLAQCQHELEKWQQEAQEQKEDLAKRAEAALKPSKSCTNLGLCKFFFWSFSTAHKRLVDMGGFQNLLNMISVYCMRTH